MPMSQSGLSAKQDNRRMLAPVHTLSSPITLQPSDVHRLGPRFHTPVMPEPVHEAHWVAVNQSLMRHWSWPEPRPQVQSPPSSAETPAPADAHDPLLQALAGNALLPGSEPIASVYSGHQFGVWAGQLGDGRALLLGTLHTPDGRQEIQLKGAGLTPYSRMGDGRAVLRSSIREYLCSEAMHALGIPSTRALCIVGSPLPVYREQAETAAIVTRTAPSFLRFGHCEHFAADGDTEALRDLLELLIERHLPEVQEELVQAGDAKHDPARRYGALLRAVVVRTARMVAQWQAVGFCHGVMNTDNMSLLGLTLDYGPFQFLDAYDPAHICNHTDRQGRYAYQRQQGVAYWNLHALARALMLLMDDSEAARQALSAFEPAFESTWQTAFLSKLGLSTPNAAQPQAAAAHLTVAQALLTELLAQMQQSRVDYTRFWRQLSHAAADPAHPGWLSLRDSFIDRDRWDSWAARYQTLLDAHAAHSGTHRSTLSAAMLATNPAYVLRNYLAEQAIRQAQAGDFSEIARLLQLLQAPYTERPDCESYTQAPPDWAQHLHVSCSS